MSSPQDLALRCVQALSDMHAPRFYASLRSLICSAHGNLNISLLHHTARGWPAVRVFANALPVGIFFMESNSKKAANHSIDTFFLESMFGWTREVASIGFNATSPHIVEAVQQMAEQHFTRTRALYQKIEAAGHDSTEMLRATCTTVTDTVTALNTKLWEAGRVNSDATLDYAQKLLGVRSLSELAEVSTTHGRKQLEIWAEQARELSALSQTATKAAVEPIRNSMTKAMKAAA